MVQLSQGMKAEQEIMKEYTGGPESSSFLIAVISFLSTRMLTKHAGSIAIYCLSNTSCYEDVSRMQLLMFGNGS